MVDHTHATRKDTLENVQAHLLRASKFQLGDRQLTRNWSLFLFFRILPQAEFDATLQRMKSAMTDGDGAKQDLWLDFAQPALLNAGLVEQRLADAAPSAPDGPAQVFLEWLKAIVSADRSGIERIAKTWMKPADIEAPEPDGAKQAQAGFDWANPSAWIASQFESGGLETGLLRQLVQIYAQPDEYLVRLQSLSENLATTASNADDRLGPLPIVLLYEILRQCAPAMTNPTPTSASSGIIRGEPSATASPEGNAADATPINIAFTYSGLAALKLNDATLASFPVAFKQGMAARALLLHDTGPSAPEHWEGELGLPSVHGYFTGGFPLGRENPVKESFWKAMRRDVEAFNDPVEQRGRMLRFWFQILFRIFGLEILHIELGLDPYTVDKATGAVTNPKDRVEHFGFRDGLSQPFVDMALGDTLPGGGTPSRDRTWTPVAPGEIFLNLPDEDGAIHLLPISKKLTVGATFLVFRKLEQDVAGFRSFLSRRRPKDPDAQKALSAQFVGRWPNGVPLVLSPDDERAVDRQMEATLNDFRYAADDPLGRKCPLGAHIRRANPRDIGGRGEVRRHRMLRRGISYGGPLLKDGALHDGERRGLLFIAANSRIDQQFEVVQANWINGGEFLGQAGLGRCPLIGNHDGAVSDSFLETGAAAPVAGLPRFVTTRGGDYFFAPGIEALRAISQGDRFDPEQVPFGGFSMGDAATPALFELERLQQYGQTILRDDKKTAIHVKLPSSSASSPDRLCFIGRYDDVKRVLRDEESRSEPGQPEFSVRHYRQTAQYITRGSDMVIGTDQFGATKSTRARLYTILGKAWQALAKAYEADGIANVVRAIARSSSSETLRRTAYARRIDLVNDLASRATYEIITRLYGVPGPDFLTELGAALPFAHQHVGNLPPDWIAKLMDRMPDDPGFATLQIWSAVILADLVGNVQSVQELHALSRQAGSEMLNHLDTIISIIRTSPIQSPRTLVEAFIKNESSPEIAALYNGGTPSAGSGNWQPLYYRDVSAILLEIVGTSMATVPLTFASVMQALFKFRIDLPNLVRLPGVDLSRIILEAERLNPNMGVRMRYCETTTTLPSGATIEKGEWVASLVGAANLDPRVFREPFRFSLDPNLRKIEAYLLFNEQESPRACWGRDRVAMVVLRECLMAASRLQGLRRVAGKRGEPAKLIGVTIGLPARFTQVASNPASPPSGP